MELPTYSEMKEKGGIWACHLCKGTDKWCTLELDDEQGAICERHGVVVPNAQGKHPATTNLTKDENNG